jgi:sec-independent protein translocase protein TatC
MTLPGDSLEHTRMSLGEHLEELRRRLVRCILAFLVVFIAAWVLRDELALRATWPWRQAVGRINADLVERAEARLVAEPGLARSVLFLGDDPADQRLRGALEERLLAIGVGEGFFLALSVSLYFAALVAGPYVLWELWQFIAAGLYRHEKRLVGLYFPFSLLLFLTGVSFCYFLVVPSGLFFLATTMPIELVRPELSAEKYFSFLSSMCLAMGAIFQLPILMVFFAAIGLVEPKS